MLAHSSAPARSWRDRTCRSSLPRPAMAGVTGQLEPLPGMTCGVWQMRPESTGHVRACSPDPQAPPAIQPNYLMAAEDRRAAVEGLRWARRLLSTEALAPWLGPEI